MTGIYLIAQRVSSPDNRWRGPCSPVVSPSALEDIVRPRRQSGPFERPFNFTVRHRERH